MQEKIRARISQAIEEKVFPGCTIGIVKRGGEGLVLPFGHFTYENDSPTVTENSIFDVASITKAIPTSSLALKLIDAGKLKTEGKLIDFLPEFQGAYRDEIKIWHLLTMTLDFQLNSLSSYKDESQEKILEIILKADLKHSPGKTFLYTNSSSILLGLAIERVTNKNLDELAREHFFEPLGMSRTAFWPLRKFSKDEIVPTEEDGWRDGVLQGEVHDESAYAFMKAGKVVGSAGLFSTVPDLLNFLKMLLNEGVLDGKRYLSSEIIKEVHTNQIGDLGYQGLGWELYRPHYMGRYATHETFGKTGFTGCVVICDAGKGVGVAMCSNTIYPRRKPMQEHISLINAVRRDVADIIFSHPH